MKLNFAIDLRNFDTKQYEQNPVVTYNFDDSQLVGRATIAKDKQSVTVEFAPKEINPLTDLIEKTSGAIGIAPAYIQGDKDEIVCLSVLPRSLMKPEGDN